MLLSETSIKTMPDIYISYELIDLLKSEKIIYFLFVTQSIKNVLNFTKFDIWFQVNRITNFGYKPYVNNKVMTFAVQYSYFKRNEERFHIFIRAS